MMGRFTERAQRSIALSQQAAAELGHGYVGTEHLLLGLLREGQGVASALQNQGVTRKGIRKLQQIIGGGNGQQIEPQDFTPRPNV